MEQYTRAELLMSVDPIWSICERSMYAFEKCKIEKGDDPEVCLRYAIAVSGCTQKIMQELTKECKQELDKAVHCLEENNMRSVKCDKERVDLSQCFKLKSFEKFQ
ncbi:putative NADH dehydrogenase [Heterostelium album PN500]|uniref:Putative NADH dehydrogenase n=1 Tax=Heterostelium pallidum (strain ATCC 26659 / Pp 5 / PN500) TaxID=670386 RepID=D3BUW7_HETP5|nr:putative NADH dehydrogenase [Heterostelium album PN500]EFA74905.1 putative NADH dehydrogenase [Heterostelium album PN500]|eukprot:XP_020427039.1 putative NADH dehydrogenase [Heterostelium album PN500]